MADEKEIPVRVALRCRPLVNHEIRDGCQLCVRCIPNEPQVVVGADKAFTFDYVYSPESSQEEIYRDVISKLIGKLFEGFNVTVLAYGQTGSGKTFTMGTNYNDTHMAITSNTGIIPRAIQDIFTELNSRIESWEIAAKVSFLEILKEDILDLLSNGKERESIAIREDTDGEIKVVGLTEVDVSGVDQTLRLLMQGSQTRTTAATLMNAGSSRSHAVFSLFLTQKKHNTGEVIRSKFHLVDLAGSERAKKTGAQGERFREGVNINKGLLALGNVISSLCDNSYHVPYRDSKLTRLLQDSLGGNSYTVMLACVSPADMNMEETINTLRYADRARKIKNKPIINKAPVDSEVLRLQEEIKELRHKVYFSNEGNPNLIEECDELKKENKQLKKELNIAVCRATALCEKNLQVETSFDKVVHAIDQLKEKARLMEQELAHSTYEDPASKPDKYKNAIEELLKTIGELQAGKGGEPVDLLLSRDNVPKNFDKDSDEDNDFNLEETLRKAAFVKEWEELERSLAMKEELASKMKLSESQLTLVKEQYETNLKQLEEEVNILQREKDELQNVLRTVKANTNATKVSEQRRKRLNELEAKLSQTRKKMQEQERMLKMKEEAEKKVKTLQEEIKVMKQQRVRLMRQMKTESERHKQVKLEKEKELATLRQQDRKRQFELLKIERQHMKQKSVWQRKMEEAIASNRRLQAALQQKQSVAERRETEQETSAQGIGARVQRWLSHEVAVATSSKEAKYHLQILVDDRKALSEELHHLKSTQTSRKRSASGESVSSNTSPESSPDKERIAALEQEIRLRSSEIQDLQQRILDVDQDEKSKHRWESIRSMLEAKVALQWLFDQTTSYQLNAYMLEGKKAELLSTIEEQNTAIDKLQRDLEIARENHKQELMAMEQEHEDKTIYLLKQMQQSGSSDDSAEDQHTAERMKFLEEEIDRFSHLHEDLKRVKEENEQLKKQLTISTCKGKKVSLLPEYPKRHLKTTADPYPLEEDSEQDFEEDCTKDPDWSRTPLSKRIKSTKKKSSLTSGCGCQGTCSHRTCGCQKNSTSCSSKCRCDMTKCRNRNSTDDKENSSSSSSDASLNQTYCADSNADLASGGFSGTLQTSRNRNSSDAQENVDFLIPKKKIKKDKILPSGGLMKNVYKPNTSFFSPVH